MGFNVGLDFGGAAMPAIPKARKAALGGHARRC